MPTNDCQSRFKSVSKTRTRTFTGCWTCRYRHIKCDEQRPSCQRCAKAKRKCEGYNIRLSWSPSPRPSLLRPIRNTATNAHCSTLARPLFTECDRGPPRLSEPLKHSDLGSQSIATDFQFVQQYWGLEALTSQDKDYKYASDISLISTSIFDGSLTLLQPFVYLEDSYLDSDPPFSTGSHHYMRELTDKRAPSSPRKGEWSYESIFYDHRVTPENLNSSFACGNDAGHRPVCIRSALNYDDLLPDTSLRSYLLEHFTMHLCDALLPVPGLTNPLRTLVVPIALEGMRTSTGHAATALFHLVCSTSAFSLSLNDELEHRRVLMASLALRHYGAGIRHLRQGILLNQPNEYVPMLAALTMCLTAEAVAIRAPFWEIHVRGGCQWIRNIDPKYWCESTSASIVYQMFAGLIIVVQSQLALDGEESYTDPLFEFQHPSNLYSLDRIYGIPPQILNLIFSMNTYERQIAAAECSSTKRPSTLVDIDTMEIQIFSSLPNPHSLADDFEHSRLINHHSHIYYYSSMIYFKRTIRKLSVCAVQPLIETCLAHIEALHSCTSRPYSPLIWPVAFIAAEALHLAVQKRLVRWLDLITETSKFQVWQRVKGLAQEIWSLRETPGNDPNLGWREFMRRMPEWKIPLL